MATGEPPTILGSRDFAEAAAFFWDENGIEAHFNIVQRISRIVNLPKLNANRSVCMKINFIARKLRRSISVLHRFACLLHSLYSVFFWVANFDLIKKSLASLVLGIYIG